MLSGVGLLHVSLHVPFMHMPGSAPCESAYAIHAKAANDKRTGRQAARRTASAAEQGGRARAESESNGWLLLTLRVARQ